LGEHAHLRLTSFRLGIRRRFQSVMAAQCSAISLSKTSIGFFQPSVLRGSAIRFCRTLSRSSWVCKDMYWFTTSWTLPPSVWRCIHLASIVQGLVRPVGVVLFEPLINNLLLLRDIHETTPLNALSR
jgi:hypothetical protein